MTILYSIHLSRSIKGFGKPSVAGVRAVLSGPICPTKGDMVNADKSAVRDCLPHYWRAAFDRAGNSWREADGREYWNLYGSRGKYLQTVYAIPYDFNCAA